jgi:hypothetical protein
MADDAKTPLKVLRHPEHGDVLVVPDSQGEAEMRAVGFVDPDDKPSKPSKAKGK